MTTTTVERTLAAEVRAVTEGHRAILRDGKVSVVSDTTPGVHWLVTAEGNPGGGVIFRCRPDDFAKAAGRGHLAVCSATPGHAPCKHSAVGARALERAGIIRWAYGFWVVADRVVAPKPANYDPFCGLT